MKRGIITIVIWALSFWTLPAQATLITIQIEGVVDNVWDAGNYLEGKIKVGDIITGFYTYESTTPDSSPLDPVVGHYWHYDVPAGVLLTVGGFNFKTDYANVEFLIGVGNNGPSGNDGYWFTSYNNLALSNGTSVDSIGWQLEDPTGNALSSDALPTTAPVLSDWQSEVGLHIYGYKDIFHLSATVTSAQMIPEPGVTVLLALGGLTLRRRVIDKKVKH
jgi:hypothetical protein